MISPTTPKALGTAFVLAVGLARAGRIGIRFATFSGMADLPGIARHLHCDSRGLLDKNSEDFRGGLLLRESLRDRLVKVEVFAAHLRADLFQDRLGIILVELGQVKLLGVAVERPEAVDAVGVGLLVDP